MSGCWCLAVVHALHNSARLAIYSVICESICIELSSIDATRIPQPEHLGRREYSVARMIALKIRGNARERATSRHSS